MKRYKSSRRDNVGTGRKFRSLIAAFGAFCAIFTGHHYLDCLQHDPVIHSIEKPAMQAAFSADAELPVAVLLRVSSDPNPILGCLGSMASFMFSAEVVLVALGAYAIRCRRNPA